MSIAIDAGLVAVTIVQVVYWYWRITGKPLPLHRAFRSGRNIWAVGLFIPFVFLLLQSSRFDNVAVTFLVLVVPPGAYTWLTCLLARPVSGEPPGLL